MRDVDKTRDQLISEVRELRRKLGDKPYLEMGRRPEILFGDQLRKKAEVQLEDETCVLPPTFAAEYAKKLIHELRVHQVELEMQNAELRSAEAEIEESRSRYVDLYDFAPCGYLTLNKQGQIVDLNLTAAMQLGIERGRLINTHFQNFILQPDKKEFFSHLSAVFEKRERQISEVRLSPKNGEQLHARLESIHMEQEEGAGLCRMNVSDVTFRKKAEVALAENEDRFWLAMDLAKLVHWEYDVETGMFHVHQQFFTLYGTSSQLEGGPLMSPEVYARKFIPPEESGVIAEAIAKALATTDPNFTDHLEHRIIRADGEVRHIIVRYGVVCDQPGRVFKIRGVNQDITERKQAEEALQESARKYRELVEHANSIILRWTRDGQITFLNEFGQKFFGYSEAEILGQHVVGTIVPETESTGRDLRPLMDQIREDPLAFVHNVNENIRRNGERVWIAWTNKVDLDDQGRVVGILSIGADITERKRAEEALRESEEQFRSLAENSQDYITRYDRQLRHTYINPAGLKAGGNSASDIIGKTHRECGLPEDLCEFWTEKILHVFKTGQPYQTEFEWNSVEGEVVLDWRLVPEFDAEGRVNSVLGVSRDITSHRLAERALRQTEENFRRSLEESPLGVRIVTEMGETVYANWAILSIYGYDGIEDLKTTPTKKRYTPESYAEFQIRKEKRKQGDCDPSEYEISIVRKDGEVRHVRVVRKEILWDCERQFQVIYQDITERKRAEEALKDASEKLKFFAYSVAHDLKSPAIGVYGLTKQLSKHARDVLDEKGKTYCDQILKVSEHIAALVEKINVYIATKETLPLIETLNIPEIFKMLRDEFSVQLSIRRIEWILPESEVEINADRLSILRIFRNLIDNALKYGGESLTRIMVGYEDSEKLHIFSVSDNGRGLKEADSKRIFGLFQRNETSRGVEGAGLGLAIVKEIAGQHGGRVWVEPRGKEGITFYVSISKNLRPAEDTGPPCIEDGTVSYNQTRFRSF